MTCAVEFRVGLPDPLRYLCGLLRTATQRGARLLVVGPQPVLEELDPLLWTFQPGSFVPHVWQDDPLVDKTPVILAPQPDLRRVGRLQALVNLGPDMVDGWETLDRVIELVSENGPDKPAARERLRAYRAAGLDPTIIQARP
ncbi:DNA polymerase III subunit chi [Thiomonas bhubaneswarensis]|uniref:DNA polymerase III, chi subunit n=1 Tax=Thiomonas bhubaneswarensis TaxID=339866 RepID=A0A0K6HQM0_9BURK|nr:DNA polymerase III subunit chi [Thiomonas bhubaneswarensis]CUA93131.1 DNA polymerase III, chi subunit [Thiomonas bhubaneswarensis]